MNFLRVSSSCPSWRCISLKAIASWPSSSLESTAIGWSKSPAATFSAAQLEPLDPLAQRPGHEVAAHQREQNRDPARDEDLVAHDGDAADDVRDRVGVDDHRADPSLVADRVGGLGDGAVAGHLDPGLALAGASPPWSPPGTTSGVVAASLLESATGESCGPVGRRVTSSSVTRSPEASPAPSIRRRTSGEGTAAADRLDDPTRVPARAGGELRALLVQQAGLEPGRDVQIQRRDRHQRDREEHRREAVAQREPHLRVRRNVGWGPLGGHGSPTARCRGTGSRPRGP